jgi:myo-inositol 2-dehydrogenase/D-chiro-inositol 1-dehydrogenase
VRISSRDPAPPPISYIEVSGGIFLDMTVHDFDMARFVTGSEVVEVYAQGAVRVDPAIGEAGDLDTAVVTLRHADGCLTVIDNSRQAVYGYDQRVEAFGAGGVASSTNPFVHTGTLLTADGASGPPLPHFFLERYTTSYLLQWTAFVRYVRAGGPSPVNGADGRAPLAIGLAAWQSVREGRPVSLS